MQRGIRFRPAVILQIVGALLAGVAFGQVGPDCREPLPCDNLDFWSFDTPPAVEDSVRAEYPEIALVAGLEGTVSIEVRLDAAGTICRATIAEPVHPLLDKKAYHAVGRFRFAPATRDGLSVPGIIMIEFGFDAEREKHRLDQVYENRHRWSGALVSHSAELVAERGFRRWSYGIYRFSGVAVHGDLSVQAFETMIDFVTSCAVGTETPTLIMNHLAFEPRTRPDRHSCGDMEVYTDLAADPDHPGGRRGVCRFVVDGQIVVFADSLHWDVDDPPGNLPWRREFYD